MFLGLTISLSTCFFLLLCLGANSRSVLRPRKNYQEPSNFNAFDPSRVTQISWHPRAFLYDGFLSDEECDHLISLAKGNLTKSLVVGNDNGTSVPSAVRTSSGYFLYDQDKITDRIAERMATWTFLPVENAEPFHILHYQQGEKYEPHYDYFPDKFTQLEGGHRYATVLMYLSNVEKGGETIFPYSETYQSKDDTWSDCAKAGYAVKPKKGDAVLFFSLLLDATPDTDSLHGSCPVIEGEKWSATRWIHVHEYGDTKHVAKEGCVDEDENCPQWAAAGECEKNPIYMVGSKDTDGYCRKSCKVCQVPRLDQS